MKINAVDLFCGIGGLTNGLKKSGINVVAGIDIEPKVKFIYEKNNDTKFIQADIKKFPSSEVERLYPKDTDIRVLAGCAPCQPFSSYSYRYKGTDNNINKMDLLDSFGRIVEDIQPDVVTMENVPQLSKEPIFKKFLKTLSKLEYDFSWHIVYAPEYGVPQKRRRLVLLAAKNIPISLIPPIYDKNNYPSVRDYIYNLPKIKDGAKNEKDPMHVSPKLNSTNIKRIKSSKPGGTWHDWDKSLLLNAYKKKTGKSYTSVYGRMEWDKPAPTITTKFFGYGNGRFGHPEQNRALSYREGALLQTFPSDYVFFDDKHPLSKKDVGIFIGNAVPVKLGETIGKSILKSIKENE